MKRLLVSNGNPMETIVGFCRAVRVGPFISVGGTAPVDSEVKTVGIGDPAIQARRCLEIISEALVAAFHNAFRPLMQDARLLTKDHRK